MGDSKDAPPGINLTPRPPKPGPTVWQYKHIEDRSGLPGPFVHELEVQGTGGWELVTVLYIGDRLTGFLKRPMP